MTSTFLPWVLDSGIELIRFVQAFNPPFAAEFFRAVSFLGEEEFYLLMVPLVWLGRDQKKGATLCLLLMLSFYLNSLCKDLLGQPRPFEIASVLRLGPSEGPGFPSGHAQSALVAWGYLAIASQRRALVLLALELVALIGFSRVYLGVHFPHDVLGGWAIGAVILAVYFKYGESFEEWFSVLRKGVQVILPLIFVAGLLAIYSEPVAYSALGVFAGASLGLTLGPSSFKIPAARSIRISAVLIGLTGAAVIYFGLKGFSPAAGSGGQETSLYLAIRLVRYAMVAFWIAAVTPWLIKKASLKSRHGIPAVLAQPLP